MAYVVKKLQSIKLSNLEQNKIFFGCNSQIKVTIKHYLCYLFPRNQKKAFSLTADALVTGEDIL